MLTNGIDICIIEDDTDQRKLLERLLQRWKYTVMTANSGRDGLRLVYEQRPRILICDVCLPDMDGIQICRAVRADADLDGIYIILATAFDQQERKHRALNAGADEYLRKPYDMDELQARIRNGLRFRRLQERLERAALTDGLTNLWNHRSGKPTSWRVTGVRNSPSFAPKRGWTKPPNWPSGFARRFRSGWFQRSIRN